MTVTWMTQSEKGGKVEYGTSHASLTHEVMQKGDASSYSFNSQYLGVYTSGAPGLASVCVCVCVRVCVRVCRGSKAIFMTCIPSLSLSLALLLAAGCASLPIASLVCDRKGGWAYKKRVEIEKGGIHTRKKSSRVVASRAIRHSFTQHAHTHTRTHTRTRTRAHTHFQAFSPTGRLKEERAPSYDSVEHTHT